MGSTATEPACPPPPPAPSMQTELQSCAAPSIPQRSHQRQQRLCPSCCPPSLPSKLLLLCKVMRAASIACQGSSCQEPGSPVGASAPGLPTLPYCTWIESCCARGFLVCSRTQMRLQALLAAYLGSGAPVMQLTTSVLTAKLGALRFSGIHAHTQQAGREGGREGKGVLALGMVHLPGRQAGAASYGGCSAVAALDRWHSTTADPSLLHPAALCCPPDVALSMRSYSRPLTARTRLGCRLRIPCRSAAPAATQSPTQASLPGEHVGEGGSQCKTTCFCCV